MSNIGCIETDERVYIDVNDLLLFIYEGRARQVSDEDILASLEENLLDWAS
jgi:hypothetical protein